MGMGIGVMKPLSRFVKYVTIFLQKQTFLPKHREYRSHCFRRKLNRPYIFLEWCRIPPLITNVVAQNPCKLHLYIKFQIVPRSFFLERLKITWIQPLRIEGLLVKDKQSGQLAHQILTTSRQFVTTYHRHGCGNKFWNIPKCQGRIL